MIVLLHSKVDPIRPYKYIILTYFWVLNHLLSSPKCMFEQDANNNRIGQWVNQTSNGKILQLSYSLNPEAREGTYKVIVHVDHREIYHYFKVEKYGKKYGRNVFRVAKRYA